MKSFRQSATISSARRQANLDEVFHLIPEDPAETLMRGLGTGAITASMAVSFREEKLALHSDDSSVDLEPPSASQACSA